MLPFRFQALDLSLGFRLKQRKLLNRVDTLPGQELLFFNQLIQLRQFHPHGWGQGLCVLSPRFLILCETKQTQDEIKDKIQQYRSRLPRVGDAVIQLPFQGQQRKRFSF